ncbi:MAG TPA: S8 family peptidase [Longimicrobiaceae bacterium]|nr:S8 family peptidase [Longimicrobiaceae bacterium]
MKLNGILGVLVLGMAACAPPSAAPPVPAPAPEPAAAPPAEPTAPPPAAPEPDAVLAAAPANWWLLDEAADGVPGISAARAYDALLAGKEPGQTVVVAVIDSGVDDEHEDLDDNLWVNDDEVPGNGADDDANGYVDDVNGWNFIGGPGGEHVRFDTYEVTRIFAKLSDQYERADPDTLAGQALAGYERFLEIRDAFQEDRAEAEAQLQQIRAINAAVDGFVAILRQELAGDSLTAENVAAIQSLRPEVNQAKQIFLQISAQGITPEQIDQQLESLEGRVEYGLNPDFNPRSIVGDDYSDLTEIGYGNPDIEGPAAEHGTHVAGIIAAERGNGIGIDGIAPSTEIMVIRAVPDGDERDKDVANAIRYAVDNGADIINMSFGKAYSPDKEVVDAAARYADEHGVLMIHAAGNAGADLGVEPSYPSRIYEGGGQPELWMEVGASSWQGIGQLAAPFSNYGDEEVDVFAPGVAIRSTVPESDYAINSGTSMAAPVVSGLAALLMAYYPELSAGEVKQIILDSATRYPEAMVMMPGAPDDTVAFGELSTTGGIVNAFAAIGLAEERTGN